MCGEAGAASGGGGGSRSADVCFDIHFGAQLPSYKYKNGGGSSVMRVSRILEMRGFWVPFEQEKIFINDEAPELRARAEHQKRTKAARAC